MKEYQVAEQVITFLRDPIRPVVAWQIVLTLEHVGLDKVSLFDALEGAHREGRLMRKRTVKANLNQHTDVYMVTE